MYGKDALTLPVAGRTRVTDTDPMAGGLSRRRLLGAAAIGGSTLAVAGAGVGYAARSAAS
jgi:hypothetical protein